MTTRQPDRGEYSRIGARVLEVMLEHPAGCTVPTVADALGVQLATARRHVAALCQEGHLERICGGGPYGPAVYRFGPRLRAAAIQAARSWLLELGRDPDPAPAPVYPTTAGPGIGAHAIRSRHAWGRRE